MEEKTLPTAEQIPVERNDPPPTKQTVAEQTAAEQTATEQTAAEQTAAEQTRAGTIGAEGDAAGKESGNAAGKESGNAAGKESGNAAEQESLFRRLCGRPPRAARRRLFWAGVALLAAGLLFGVLALLAQSGAALVLGIAGAAAGLALFEYAYGGPLATGCTFLALGGGALLLYAAEVASWTEALEIPGWLAMLVGVALLLSIGFRWLCVKVALLPAAAALLDIGGALLLAFGGWYAAELLSLGALIFVAGLLMTCVGVVVAIAALCNREHRGGRAGAAIASLAAALPILAAIVIVLLFSTGVIRISLM